MTRVPRISIRQATRTRRLSRRWLAAALITGAVALLAPGVSYATASQSSPAAAGCRGVTPAALPALGFITGPGRTQGGHLWWRRSVASSGAASTGAANTGVCIGTVVEWVQYNTTMTKTWKVIVYSAQNPHGQIVASRTFTLGRGVYFWSFGVHRVFPGLSSVCITADDSFGMPCIDFG